ncbi:hypothetical protein [Escherichia coli]|nr:hypothetical protein [Escherichia coli]
MSGNIGANPAYQINLLDKSDYVLAHGLNTDDQLAFGIVYQF